jgi:hypothetical protein
MNHHAVSHVHGQQDRYLLLLLYLLKYSQLALFPFLRLNLMLYTFQVSRVKREEGRISLTTTRIQ